MFAQENIYFTDCVLRHMHQYRFLAHFDPDELPILPKHDSITHLLNDLVEKYVSHCEITILLNHGITSLCFSHLSEE